MALEDLTLVGNQPDRHGTTFDQAMRAGLVAVVALAVITVVEYVIATKVGQPIIPIIVLAIAKGWIILNTFMHIQALRSEEH